MGKQTVLSHFENNYFDTKGGGAFEDAAKSPNNDMEMVFQLNEISS